MRIEQLQYLVETARCSSISKAGEKLHITQQSLNNALKKLEAEMGAPLFERSYAGIKLTEQGKIAVRRAEEVLGKVDDMLREVSHCQACTDEALRGHLILYASPSALHSLIPRATQILMRQHQQITTTLMEKENRDMVRSIMQGEPCACITSVVQGMDRDFEMLDRKKVFYQKLTEAKMYISVSENHPLAQQKSVSAHTLLKYPLGIYLVNDRAPQVACDWLAQKGKPNIHLTTNNLRVYRRAIDAGQIVGFLPKLMCKNAIDIRDGIVYLPVKDFPLIETVCTMDWDYYHAQENLIIALLECIEEVLND